MQLTCKYFLLAIFLHPTLTAGTASLRIVAVDPMGARVGRAHIGLEPGGRAADTDTSGEALIAGLPPGEYLLTAASEGFEPVPAQPVRLSEGASAAAVVEFKHVQANHLQLDVVGLDAESALKEVPGSAYVLDPRELSESRSVDANELLRRVPGLHIREDSGPVGMRLNIGVRGLNPDRSRTLLVLEDGLPIALAPYGEPEMYYSPPIERMSRIEVLKGSGSIIHGPQTVGGVLSFTTPDPPVRPAGMLELTGGERGLLIGQASYGATRGRVGWYLNGLRKQGDGWRDFYFDINDFLTKLNVDLSPRQRLGVKLGAYQEGSNSTYLGLTESQFRRDPNFNAVPDDLLKVRRYSGSLLHQFFPSSRLLLTTSLFGYATTRNWRRQDFDRVRRPGVAYRRVIGDELFLRDSSANNNRDFAVAGAEVRLSAEHRTFGVAQRLESGLRYIRERHRDRRIDGATYLALDGVIREDEVRDGDAVAGFVQDRLFLTPKLTVTPGLRVEDFAYARHLLRQAVDGVPADVRITRGDAVRKAIPGVGAAWQAARRLTLFAGLHRGFAPPRIKDAITRSGVSLRLDAELSWNYEAGARLNLDRGLKTEATFFTTDFSNQIIPAAQSGGATTTLINAGRTLHRGVEFVVSADGLRLAGPSFPFWVEFRQTWLPTARFASGIYLGNRLPYAPEHNSGLTVGYRHRSGLSLHLDGTRVSRQFGDNRQTVAASPDGTVGLLPAYWVWNASASREFRRERFSLSPFVTVKNLADEIYISSRAPLGIQPGMFRQVNGGLKVRF